MKRMLLFCALAVVWAGYGYMLSPHRTPPSPRDLMPRKGALRIRPAEATHVKFVKYADPSGYFTMDVPLGWRVKTGLKPDGKIDLITPGTRTVLLPQYLLRAQVRGGA